jgi:hypothetical protein
VEALSEQVSPENVHRNTDLEDFDSHENSHQFWRRLCNRWWSARCAAGQGLAAVSLPWTSFFRPGQSDNRQAGHSMRPKRNPDLFAQIGVSKLMPGSPGVAAVRLSRSE